MKCPTCKGSGTKPARKCPKCNGVIVEVGHCDECWNAGYIADTCDACSGSGEVKGPS